MTANVEVNQLQRMSYFRCCGETKKGTKGLSAEVMSVHDRHVPAPASAPQHPRAPAAHLENWPQKYTKICQGILDHLTTVLLAASSLISRLLT